jgi:hypothetical protein
MNELFLHYDTINKYNIRDFEINVIQSQIGQLTNHIIYKRHPYIDTFQQFNFELNKLRCIFKKLYINNYFNDTMELCLHYNNLLTFSIDELKDRFKWNCDKFNELLSPHQKFNPIEHIKHRNLLDLIDFKYMKLFEENGSQCDINRLNCLQNNGALSWLNVPYNMEWSIKFSNQEMFVLLSLILGCRIYTNDIIKCKRCHEIMDPYGYHCLQCSKGGYVIQRHNNLCKFLFKMVKRAGFEAQREQKYHSDDNGNMIENKERPGDIKILNFEYDDGVINPVYFDLVVGNIFSNNSIKHGYKERLWLGKQLERKKKARYQNKCDILGLGVEVLGGHSHNLSNLMHVMAEHLKMRTEVCDSIWMNRIRSQFNAILMKFNAMMVIASGDLVEDMDLYDCYDIG